MTKRKTREEKTKSGKRIIDSKITYSYKSESKTPFTIALPDKEIDYHRKELKRILIASLVIFTLNIILYTLLTTNALTLGFLGY